MRDVQLKRLVAERGINAVFHFTQIRNLVSILKYGVLSRAELEARRLSFAYNDDLRSDNCPEAICLSISFPNYRMLYARKCENPQNPWAILECSPDLLWEADCAFCEANASHAGVSRTSVQERRGFRALARLFEGAVIDGRRVDGLPLCHPTNPQAEVLLFGTIPSSAIRCLHFETRLLLDASADLFEEHNLRGPKMAVTPRLFKPRDDWEDWASRRRAGDGSTVPPKQVPTTAAADDIPF